VNGFTSSRRTQGANSVNTTRKRLLAGALAASLVLAACGDDDDDTTEASEPAGSDGTDGPVGTESMSTEPMTTESGTSQAPGDIELAAGQVFVTGSSTVEPITIRVGELASQLSGGDLQVTVEGPGTGDGFAKFCAGDADVSDASRPIRDEEAAECEANGIEFVEIEVAIDGLSVITNPANTAVECIDVPGLYALLGPESEGFGSWSDANDLAAEVGSAYAPFPEAPLVVFGPGEESGTYDTFVEFAIADLAEERVGEDSVFTRADYSSSANDNLIVEGIESADTSLGWVGYAFYVAEGDRLAAIEIDGGDGCVAPTEETIADGSYPFSRSLYIYVSKASAEANPAVVSFIDLYLSEQGLATVSEAGYVDLPADRIQASQAAWAGR
jgi:phosphate transport system substrate-binding protein